MIADCLNALQTILFNKNKTLSLSFVLNKKIHLYIYFKITSRLVSLGD